MPGVFGKSSGMLVPSEQRTRGVIGEKAEGVEKSPNKKGFVT